MRVLFPAGRLLDRWRNVPLRVAAFLLAVLMLGCRGQEPVAMLDTPPLPAPKPGVFRDINPRFSPDGKQVAFIRTFSDRTQQLMIAPVTGLEQATALTEPEVVCPDRPYSPGLDSITPPDTLAWSPDGRKIAFTRAAWFKFGQERLPGSELWSINLATRQAEPLADRPEDYSGEFRYYKNPQWSPDGRRLSFTGEGFGGRRAIFIRNLDVIASDETAPRYDKYADSDWAVWGSNPSKKVASLIFRQGIRRAPYSALTESIRCITPGASALSSPGELWRLATRETAALFPAMKGDAIPRISSLAPSPDGKTIVFCLTPNALDLTYSSLWIMNRDGSNPHALFKNEGAGYFAPMWRGKSLFCLSTHRSRFMLCKIQGGKFLPLIDSQSSDFDITSDGRLIVSSVQGKLDLRAPSPTPPPQAGEGRFNGANLLNPKFEGG